MNEFLNKSEASELLNIDVRTLDKMIEAGQVVPTYNVGSTVRISRQSLINGNFDSQRIVNLINEGTAKMKRDNAKIKGDNDLSKEAQFKKFEDKNGFKCTDEYIYLDEKERERLLEASDLQLQKVIDLLNWRKTVSKDFDFNENHAFKMALDKFSSEEVYDAMIENENNTFTSLAKLDGFENFNDWLKNSAKERKKDEAVIEAVNKGTEKINDLNDLKEVFKEAIKEASIKL